MRRHDVLLFCGGDWLSFIIVEDVFPVGTLRGLVEDYLR